MNTKFLVKGMHCSSCEKLITDAVKDIKGVERVKIEYKTERGEVTFDGTKTSTEQIFKAIEKIGYRCSIGEKQDSPKGDSRYYTFNLKVAGFAFVIIGVLLVGYFVFRSAGGASTPEISRNMGYGLLFLVGLLTGFHCVTMCGGFVVSYTAKHANEGSRAYKSHSAYAVGKLISYTLIGAAFGLLGSIITFTPLMRGVAGVIAGIFLVIFGLNMLNVFPWLRKIRISTPVFLNRFVSRNKNSSPLAIGLLNGLMIACGPLQAVYIMAAGTGSALEGAKLLFVFALGTLPVMLSFGFLTSYISKKATHKILKASGIIVIVLGLIMVNRGLALTGAGLDANSIFASTSAAADSVENSAQIQDGYQIIRMDVDRYGWNPDKFVLKKGVPVKWIINGKEINGCNNAIQVPKLGLKFDIKKGEQVVEFTPNQEGVISWSCWMGMIPGAFIVKENIDLGNEGEVQKELAAVPKLERSSCGGSGGCGCGGGR